MRKLTGWIGLKIVTGWSERLYKMNQVWRKRSRKVRGWWQCVSRGYIVEVKAEERYTGPC